jgi:hypothetical protein
VLPGGWQIVKGPSIYRESKRVALTASAPPPNVPEPELEAVRESFRLASGYELALTLLPAAPTASQNVPPKLSGEPSDSGQRLEINAAYAAIRAGLAGTSLYRTSLKGDEILLSFISPQVGERHRQAIDTLARQTGWKLGINPQSNQGAILEAAREVLQTHGWTVLKGPSLHLERAQVAATLSAAPEPEVRAAAEAEVLERTGFQLALSAAPDSRPGAVAPAASLPAAGLPATVSPAGPPEPPAELVEIPLERIRLSRHYQALALNPEKLAKTIDRLRRAGPAAAPVRVRRLTTGYLLLDGLYRLRAAEQLGLERMWALVE